MSGEPCATCAAYRRGEHENVVAYGFTVHTCERKRHGHWSFLGCPCGCVPRTPGLIASDKALYGNAFIGPRGQRIDPTTVTELDDDQHPEPGSNDAPSTGPTPPLIAHDDERGRAFTMNDERIEVRPTRRTSMTGVRSWATRSATRGRSSSSSRRWSPMAPGELTRGSAPRYDVKIVMRDGGGQVSDDWHATVTRKSDHAGLVFIAGWLWLLRWRTRRAALDRAFRRYDHHQAKLAAVRRIEV